MPAITSSTAAPVTTPIETSTTATRPTRQRCSHAQEDDGPDRSEAPQRRGNPLVSAMMSALATLMPSRQADAPPTGRAARR